MTTHTPGPWQLAGIHVIAPQSKWVSELDTVAGAHGIHGDDGSIQKANARLIAAAPELLEALQMQETAIRRYLAGHDTDTGYVLRINEKARTVIAKALAEPTLAA